MEFTNKKRSAAPEERTGSSTAAGSSTGRRRKGAVKVKSSSAEVKADAMVEDVDDEGADDVEGVVEGMVAEDGEQLVFEDPFGDEFEDEEFHDEEDFDDDAEGDESAVTTKAKKQIEDDAKIVDKSKQTWRPGVDRIGEGEELDYDPSAYVLYHSLRTEWPCLSFDIMRDDLGDNRQRFPMTMYVACGSQADRGDKNKITLLKLSDLHKTQVEAESDEESDDDDDLDEDPVLEHVNIPHQGGVNRIRCMPQNPGVIASMADTRVVNIFDASSTFKSLLRSGAREAPPTKPLYQFRGHKDEGFAIDWSSVLAGRLATGDCSGCIHITNSNGSTFTTDNHAYRGHTSSVEDLQWSPSEATVFISCSADRSLRIWDVRGKGGPQITVANAHAEDVNVCSWNRNVSYLVASGSDDGSFKVEFVYVGWTVTATLNSCACRCGICDRSGRSRNRWQILNITADR
jgi:ribosome assembly protein RRB1